VYKRQLVDRLWEKSLGESIDETGFNADGSMSGTVPRFHDLATKTNAFNQRHSDKYKTWNDLLDIELQGAVDVAKGYFECAVKYMYCKSKGEPCRVDLGQQFDNSGGMDKFVYSLFYHKMLTTQFPSIWIGANLFASLRWNKTERMQGGDHYDFAHATCALPYCDAFFTDRRTAHHITNSQTKLDVLYGCRVRSSLKDLPAIVS